MSISNVDFLRRGFTCDSDSGHYCSALGIEVPLALVFFFLKFLVFFFVTSCGVLVFFGRWFGGFCGCWVVLEVFFGGFGAEFLMS